MIFNKETYTISDVCKMLGLHCPEHIKTNPKLSRVNNAQYDIIRSCAHDGTYLFTYELLYDAIKNLLFKTSYYTEDNMDDVKDVEYEIGLISIATVFQNVDLPCGNYPGEKQRVRIPVKCKLIKNELRKIKERYLK